MSRTDNFRSEMRIVCISLFLYTGVSRGVRFKEYIYYGYSAKTFVCGGHAVYVRG